MVVDCIVLYQTVAQLTTIKDHVDAYVFTECYEPQLFMRIIFTCYAVNAACLCFLLTLSVAYLQEDLLERVALSLFTYTYLTFGPLLLLFSLLGLCHLRSLLFQCSPSQVTGQLNYMDGFVLVGCTVFSGVITLMFSMHKAVEMAQEALRDETSVFYRLFVSYLGYRRRKLRQQQEGYEGVGE